MYKNSAKCRKAKAFRHFAPARLPGAMKIRNRLFYFTAQKSIRMIRIFIMPSAARERKRKKPLTAGSLRSL